LELSLPFVADTKLDYTPFAFYSSPFCGERGIGGLPGRRRLLDSKYVAVKISRWGTTRRPLSTLLPAVVPEEYFDQRSFSARRRGSMRGFR